MFEPHISFTGNVSRAPELRTTPTGRQVADLSVAVTRRIRVGEAWEPRQTVWFKVSCWDTLADNVTSLGKGDGVTVVGRVVTVEPWTREDGSTATSVIVDAVSVAADLKHAKVKVIKPIRPGSTAEHLEEKWVDRSTGEVHAAEALEEDLDEQAA